METNSLLVVALLVLVALVALCTWGMCKLGGTAGKSKKESLWINGCSPFIDPNTYRPCQDPFTWGWTYPVGPCSYGGKNWTSPIDQRSCENCKDYYKDTLESLRRY